MVNINAKLDDNNRDKYISEIKEVLNRYLLDGIVSYKSDTNFSYSDLTIDELNILKSVHFLISDPVRDLFSSIPNLVRNLAHSTTKENIECRGVIRGKVDWSTTIKTRYTYGFNDPSLFVCSPPSKHYDLEENQLLKWILKKVINLYHDYLMFIKSESNKYFNENLMFFDNNSNWYDIINHEYAQSRSTLRKVYFDEITDINFINSKIINKCLKHRNPLYHKVAKVYLLHQQLTNDKFLADLINNQLIVNSDNNKLFEVYVLFHLIKALKDICILDESTNKSSLNIGLWHRNSKNKVSGKLVDDTIVNIYYQRGPKVFNSDNSLYRQLTKNNRYNFNTSLRLPDIIIEFVKDDKHSYRIIEVKNSSKPEYMNDSLYKVMGYSKDFENGEINLTDNIPYVLINWMGSDINDEYKGSIFKQNIVLFNKDEFRENIIKLLSR